MTYQELIDGVITNTNRPELMKETEQAIRRSTLKMHALEYFHADISEGALTIQPTLTPRIETSQLGPNFRKLHSIHPFNNGYPSAKSLSKLQLDSVFDKAVGKQGYYTLGGTINIKANAAISKLLIRFYTTPLVAADNYNSWIASSFPYAIIDDATAAVLASVGNIEKANRFAVFVGSKLPKPSGHILDILANSPFGDDPEDYADAAY